MPERIANHDSDSAETEKLVLGLAKTVLDVDILSPYLIANPVEEVEIKDCQSWTGDQFFEARSVVIGDSLDWARAYKLVGAMYHLESLDPEGEITFYINSHGGHLESAQFIYQVMDRIEPDIRTVCSGQAASAAAPLLANGTPGKRYIVSGAEVMIHAGTYVFSTRVQTYNLDPARREQYEHKLHQELAQKMDDARVESGQLDEIYYELLRAVVDMDDKQLRASCLNSQEACRMSAQQAKDNGFVDHIIDSLAELGLTPPPDTST